MCWKETVFVLHPLQFLFHFTDATPNNPMTPNIWDISFSLIYEYGKVIWAVFSSLLSPSQTQFSLTL